MKFGPNLARCFLIIPNNLSPPGDFSTLVSVMDRVKMLGLGRVAGPGSHWKQVELGNWMYSERTFSCQFISSPFKFPLPPWFTVSLLSAKWQLLYSPQAPLLTWGAFHAHKLVPLGWGYPWYLESPLLSSFPLLNESSVSKGSGKQNSQSMKNFMVLQRNRRSIRSDVRLINSPTPFNLRL